MSHLAVFFGFVAVVPLPVLAHTTSTLEGEVFTDSTRSETTGSGECVKRRGDIHVPHEWPGHWAVSGDVRGNGELYTEPSRTMGILIDVHD